MLILGLQGSPRAKGNTRYLLSAFMNEATKRGAQTHIIDINKTKIAPCRGCGYCEKNGFCIIEDDDMMAEIFPLLRQADIIVVATPIYFYNVTAQLKGLIDRSQALWSRRYRFNLADPGQRCRQGVLLAQGATRGKNLFDGINLTAKYFFDAVGASFNSSLTYRKIENIGDMQGHPSVLKDVKEEVAKRAGPGLNRKKILFACRENACRSQMAGAFARHLAGDRIEAFSGGSTPADKINPVMEEAMKEKGLDMAFRKPGSIDAAVSAVKPDMIITMGCKEECPFVPGVKKDDWNLPDPAGRSFEFMRQVREEIERKVLDLIDTL